MSTKDAFEERRHALEEEYFQKQSKELAHKLHQRLVQEQIGQSTGVSDEDLLKRMSDLGFGPETLAVLPLVPLLYVAWADGTITDAERRTLTEVATRRGVKGEALGRLEALMKKRPDHRFFETTFEMIRKMKEARPGTLDDLSGLARQIAEVSGGLLGLGVVSGEEKEALERIAKELESTRKKAAAELLGKL